MNRTEASQVLSAQMDKYRRLGYSTLSSMIGHSERVLVPTTSGTSYQTQVEVFWDGESGSDIRVLGSVDDGGLRSFLPITDSFLIARSDLG